MNEKQAVRSKRLEFKKIWIEKQKEIEIVKIKEDDLK